MKKYLYSFLLIGLAYLPVQSQQLGYDSQFTETKAFWNPAVTAPNTHSTFDAFFRQQWLGFNGAPQTAFASFMYPFIDMNMSAGAYLYSDATGPISRTGIKLNYSYRLKEFITDEGILAFGLSANMQSFKYNATDQIFQHDDDALILNSTGSTIFPAVGAGIYFNTNPIDYDNENNSFYIGLAFNQAYTNDVILAEGDFSRETHLHMMLGTKLMGYESYWEPSLSINYVNPDIIDFIVSVKYEKQDYFWAGLGYGSVSDVAFQGGYIIPEFMGNRYARLRIGALANMILTDYSKDLGPGFEMFIRYEIDLD